MEEIRSFYNRSKDSCYTMSSGRDGGILTLNSWYRGCSVTINLSTVIMYRQMHTLTHLHTLNCEFMSEKNLAKNINGMIYQRYKSSYNKNFQRINF